MSNTWKGSEGGKGKRRRCNYIIISKNKGSNKNGTLLSSEETLQKVIGTLTVIEVFRS